LLTKNVLFSEMLKKFLEGILYFNRFYFDLCYKHKFEKFNILFIFMLIS
jgi:hypothetical protein